MACAEVIEPISFKILLLFFRILFHDGIDPVEFTVPWVSISALRRKCDIGCTILKFL